MSTSKTKQSHGLFDFKKKEKRSHKKKKKKEEDSSSSSSSSSSSDIVTKKEAKKEPDLSPRKRDQMKKALLNMGHAMETAVLGEKKKKKDEESVEIELSQSPENEMDFLQRRKLAAAKMRIRRELEIEKEHPTRHPLLDLHHLPLALQDANRMDLTRFQVHFHV